MLPKPTERGRGKAQNDGAAGDSTTPGDQTVGRGSCKGETLVRGRGRSDVQEGGVGRGRSSSLAVEAVGRGSGAVSSAESVHQYEGRW